MEVLKSNLKIEHKIKKLFWNVSFFQQRIFDPKNNKNYITQYFLMIGNWMFGIKFPAKVARFLKLDK